MKKRKIGAAGLEVSAVGYGCMGLSHGYGETPEKDEAIALMRNAYELGCNFFDTAEAYGAGENEKLVGEGIAPIRQNLILATKFRIYPDEEVSTMPQLMKTVESHLDASLKRLKTDYVDIYYQHRVSKQIPVEAIAWCMGELIKKGKIRGWGQSQSTAEQIRLAHAVTPMTAVQSEYSMMERIFEKEVIPACGELGIGFIPFSPLGSGFLSGKYTPAQEYKGDDVRRVITRFEKENMVANQPLLDLLHQFAQEKNATPAQISLAWMLHKYKFLVPIPGSRKPERIAENLHAADLELTPGEFNRIETELANIEIHGNRTDEDIARLYQ
ncbi:aldo/keto reductase [Parabacteroides faecis]|uniref:aldo/keto reductase n=1 Tax=Parabacteroides TaxID=375288 RepID=UPI000EFFE2C0|nr:MULTISPECIES: aldo/keto reductase [Parabacteroides]MBC8617104.1 aldo/keto reductase [Parabacteroides faecis]RHS01056.1 aldo/keto reductase [Parabacteroides sp. AF14-59]